MGDVSSNRMVAIAIAVVAPLSVNAGNDPAPVDPPSPGQPCSVLHATTYDNHGHPMWCNYGVSGPNDLRWQYKFPS
jgi:hypothetical protein